jgi:hypothetical protein
MGLAGEDALGKPNTEGLGHAMPGRHTGAMRPDLPRLACAVRGVQVFLTMSDTVVRMYVQSSYKK